MTRCSFSIASVEKLRDRDLLSLIQPGFLGVSQSDYYIRTGQACCETRDRSHGNDWMALGLASVSKGLHECLATEFFGQSARYT